MKTFELQATEHSAIRVDNHVPIQVLPGSRVVWMFRDDDALKEWAITMRFWADAVLGVREGSES